MIRIALVEDEAEVRAQLQGYVQRHTRQYGTEFAVTEFADGMELLDDYRPVYDILFLDVEMKHLDGMETARLVRERVPLNICLTSNLTLLYRRREDHPLRRLLDAGAVVTLSRDDPTFLGGLTLTEELRRAAEFAYMSREELLACQEAAVDAAFCGPETKNFLRRALAEFQQS